jgi:uncharacterized membrane protein HdeD (DUF308 family)
VTTSVRLRPASKRESGNESFLIEVGSAMSSALASKARRVFAHTRLSIAVQGVLAVAIGVAVLAWPSASLAALLMVFALYAAADGLLSIVGAFAERDGAGLVQGLVSLTAAGAALVWRDTSAMVLVYVMAVWVIVMALFRVRTAIESRNGLLVKGLIVLLALLSVTGGVTALLSPGEGASSVLVNVAIFKSSTD